MNPRAAVLQLLQSCLLGEEPDREVLSALEKREDLPSRLASAVHELHHFADDQDIRARDSGHAAFWNTRLVQLRESLGVVQT
jgi:hypothetical protein